MSLARATALALHGRLNAAAGELDRIAPPRSDTRATWLRTYLAAAHGDFAVAERLARGLLRSSRADPETRARAAATLGSVLRQAKRHAEARRVEREAFRSAPPGEARAHLLIGLAADAVGLGELASVDAALGRVRVPGLDWRAKVRLGWVRCERELLAGRPGAAARHARAAAALSARHGARRHEAKSLLFLGAALLDAEERRPGRRDPGEGTRVLRRARSIAGRIGARPIASVGASLLTRSEVRARG